MDHGKSSLVFIHTLGVFDIYHHEKSLLTYFGNSKKTISLFKFFVGHIGQKLSTNRIMESVFSQYKYQDPSNTLRGHIHRLRAVLNKINEETGSKVLTIDYLADHYIFSIGPDCQVDYLEFLDEVKKKPTIDKIGQKKAAYIKQLYGGEFMLDDESHDWALPIRLDLNKQFDKYMQAYLLLHFEAERYEDLVEEVDPIMEKLVFDEDIQELYIKSLIELNRNKQAMDHYEYLIQRYEAESGIEPSEKVKKAIKRLMGEKDPSVSIDLFELEKIVRRAEADSHEGAFVCDKDFFFELFRLVIRQKSRDQRFFLVGLVSVATADFRDMDPQEMKDVQVELKKLISATIRSQDVLSLISDTQVAFILFDTLEGTVEKIGKRMKEGLSKIEKKYNLVVTINYKPISHAKEYSKESTI